MFGLRSTIPSAGASLGPYSHLTQLEMGQLLKLLLEPRRLFFFYFLFLPFLFLLSGLAPLTVLALLAMALPDLFKIGLSAEPFHYAVDGHYSMGLVAVLIVGVVEYIRSPSNRASPFSFLREPRYIVGLLIGFCVANSCLPISVAFWSNANARIFHYENYVGAQNAADMRTILAKISPLSPTVSIQATNGAMAPEFVTRKDFALLQLEIRLMLILSSLIRTRTNQLEVGRERICIKVSSITCSPSFIKAISKVFSLEASSCGKRN